MTTKKPYRSAYFKRQRRRDALAVVGGILFILFIVASFAVTIYVHFFAPCHAIGWLPAKDLPSRCFTFTRQ